MLIDTTRMLPISDAGKRGLSALASDAERGEDWVLLRNSTPVCAIVNIGRLERLQHLEEIEEDLRLMAVTLGRVILDNGSRYSLDEVLTKFGFSREDLVSGNED